MGNIVSTRQSVPAHYYYYYYYYFIPSVTMIPSSVCLTVRAVTIWQTVMQQNSVEALCQTDNWFRGFFQKCQPTSFQGLKGASYHHHYHHRRFVVVVIELASRVLFPGVFVELS